MTFQQFPAEVLRQRVDTVPSSFVIGQDPSGHWVAVETRGFGGGIFRSRKDAIQYARAETLHRADAIVIATSPVSFPI